MSYFRFIDDKEAARPLARANVALLYCAWLPAFLYINADSFGDVVTVCIYTDALSLYLPQLFRRVSTRINQR